MSDDLKILIVDDEPYSVELLTQEFEDRGYQTISASSGREALAKVQNDGLAHEFPGIVVTDIRMPEMDGLALMRRLRELDEDLPVVLVTAHGDIAMAVQAMHDGAYDFVTKPIEPERLGDTLRRALETRRLVLENRALRAELALKSGIDARLIGNSTAMVELRDAVANIGSTDASVVIHGETGTGKELVARCLHDVSARRRRRFVPVNCGALPETIIESELFGHEAGAFTGANRRRIGRIEYANEGTLFLDEIESMPMGMQVKLLRTLQEREIERLGSNEHIPVDFRVVAATKTDLKDAAARGEFREDFYFRLEVAEIWIPPLRDRIDDVPLLFEYFGQQLAAIHERDAPQLSSEAVDQLMGYGWPGNVRELRNVVERAVLGLHSGRGDFLPLLGEAEQNRLTLAQRVDAFECHVIRQTLAEHRGNIHGASEALGAPRRTLNEKMRKHHIRRQDFLDD